MGQQQFVDLQEFETKRQVTNFINTINNDTVKLQEKADKIHEEIDKRELTPQLNKFSEAFFRAQCECDAPSYVFWLSAGKREKCQTAKTEAFNQFSILCMNQIKKQELEEINNNLINHIKRLEEINNVNAKYSRS